MSVNGGPPDMDTSDPQEHQSVHHQQSLPAQGRGGGTAHYKSDGNRQFTLPRTPMPNRKGPPPNPKGRGRGPRGRDGDREIGHQTMTSTDHH